MDANRKENGAGEIDSELKLIEADKNGLDGDITGLLEKLKKL